MTTVILTRPVPSIPKAKKVYEQAGFDVFEAPVFDIETNSSVKPQWLGLKSDVWVILSVNALKHALKIKPGLEPDKHTQVIAVGPAVEKAWRKQFNHPITHHPLMNSEGVIELLKAIKPHSVKILTTCEGRDLIKRFCMSESISYTQINTYVRVPLQVDIDAMKRLLKKQNSVVLTVTSSELLNEFISQIPIEYLDQVLEMRLIVGAIRIKELAQKLNFKCIKLAKSASDEDMREAVLDY